MRPLYKPLVLLGITTSLISSATLFAQAAPATPATEQQPVAPTKTEDPKPPQKVIPKTIPTLGWKEWAWVAKPELIVRAKLDTGARTSSVHATNIEKIEIDGKQWIKFTISNPNDEKSVRLRHKAPLLRVSKIKNDDGGLDERYVVPLVFQIGKKKLEGEFNLNNRENMTCPLLIGRNILKDIGVVDSGRTDLLEKPVQPKAKAKTKP